MKRRALAEVMPPHDAEVVARLATGELDALGELYDRHHVAVRRFLARATADAEDVDDLVHTTFMTASTLGARFDGRASCRPWLMGIATQLLRRRRRSLGRFAEILASLARVRRFVDPRPELNAHVDLDRALRTLTEAKRTTLLLAEVEGLTCAEIAEAMAVPIGTVWTRLHAARLELRAQLEGSA